MTLDDIIKEVDLILEDSELKEKLKITKFDKQNIKKRRSLPKMLELLYKAKRLQITNGSTSEQTKK